MTEPKPIEENEHPPQTPDHSYVITGLAGDPHYGALLSLNTHDAILEFMQEAGRQLVELDPLWAYISAKPGERKSVVLPNNQSITADSFAYTPTVQVVNVLKNVLEQGKPAEPRFAFVTGLRDSMQENSLYPINPEAQKQKDV